MSFSLLNYAAWLLCAIIAAYLLSDFIKTEKSLRNKGENKNG